MLGSHSSARMMTSVRLRRILCHFKVFMRLQWLSLYYAAPRTAQRPPCSINTLAKRAFIVEQLPLDSLASSPIVHIHPLSASPCTSTHLNTLHLISSHHTSEVCHAPLAVMLVNCVYSLPIHKSICCPPILLFTSIYVRLRSVSADGALNR